MRSMASLWVELILLEAPGMLGTGDAVVLEQRAPCVLGAQGVVVLFASEDATADRGPPPPAVGAFQLPTATHRFQHVNEVVVVVLMDLR